MRLGAGIRAFSHVNIAPTSILEATRARKAALMTHHKGLIFGIPFVLITLAVIFVLALIFTTGKTEAVEQAVTPTLEQEAAVPAPETEIPAEAETAPGKPKVTYEKHD
jgi:hypothetical protein